MTPAEYFAAFMLFIFTCALIAYVKSGLEEKLDQLRVSYNARLDGLARRTQELSLKDTEAREYVDENLTRALTKSETAFQLAHQASIASKDAQTIRVKLSPMKFKVLTPKVNVKAEGNA